MYATPEYAVLGGSDIAQEEHSIATATGINKAVFFISFNFITLSNQKAKQPKNYDYELKNNKYFIDIFLIFHCEYYYPALLWTGQRLLGFNCFG